MDNRTEVNAPGVMAELEALFDAYEEALIANDVEALKAFFWDSPHAMRFGATEELYGSEEIAAFRKARVINFSDRKALRKTVVTLGPDFGMTALEFSVLVDRQVRRGRQTQVWARLPETGWKILSAHVSHRSERGDAGQAYAAASSRLLDVPVSPDYLAGAGLDLDTMAALAKPLMEFEFPEECEPAPRFTP